MAFQGTGFQPTAFQAGAGPLPTLENRSTRFTDGQSPEQLRGLVGFAGSALIWASAAALALFVPQPQLQAAEMLFGQHEAVVTQANQSAQFFKPNITPVVLASPPNKPFLTASPQADPTQLQPVTFLPMMQVAHGRGTFGSAYPDAELLEWNPSFFNRVFRGASAVAASPFSVRVNVPAQEGAESNPSFFNRTFFAPVAVTSPINLRVTIGSQESGEQTQPAFAGLTPLPSPATAQIRLAAPADAEAISRASEYTIFWGGKATLPIAAIQYQLPPGKEFTAAPQESGEQYQPVIVGQQPLPSPAVGLSKVVIAPTDVESVTQASQYATFWQGHAALFIAAIQFDLPPGRDIYASPQESGEQFQPVFAGQQPLPSPAVGLAKVSAPSDAEAIARASESAAFWDGKATLQIAAVQFDLPPSRRVSALSQESGEQYQPVVFGQQPLPSPALGSTRLAGPIDAEQTAVQYGTFWVGDASLYVAVTQDVPAKPELIVLAPDSGEQPQPIFSGQQPASAVYPALGPIRVSGPTDAEAIARASESAAFWDGKATLHIAAVQYDLPASKRVTASPQESAEQTQPVVVGQQPLPSPQLGSTKLAGPLDVQQTAVQYGTFWVGDATLYVAVTQDVPPKRTVVVGGQESTEQIQPQFAHPRIASAEAIASRFIWQSGDAEGSQSANFWHGQFIDDVVNDDVLIRRSLVVPEQAYQFQPQPQFNLYYFLPSVVVVPPVDVGGGGDRGVNLFREEKPKRVQVGRADFRVRFEQAHQGFAARFEAGSELRVKWVAEPFLGVFKAALEASSEFSFRAVQQSSFGLSFNVSGSPQKQVPVKAIHQPARIGVEFVMPAGELHIRFEVEE